MVTAPVGQTAAVLALLPELTAAEALPPTFTVAHAVGFPSRLLGAAAFVPRMQHAEWPGFSAYCRVLPAFRRQGVGQALMGRLAAEVTAWDVKHLHAAGTHEARGAESQFLTTLGFRPSGSIHHFVGDTASTLPMCQRLVQTLRDHGRIPGGFTVVPLAEAQEDSVAALFCRQFGGSLARARAEVKRALEEPIGQALSLALRDDQQLAGFLMAREGKQMPEVSYWVSDPSYRQGWPAALLLEGFVKRLKDLGVAQARYCCSDRTRATLNVARKTGARLDAVRHGYVIDLVPPS